MPVTVYVQILLATFLWGTAFPAGKEALSYVPPLTLAGLRFSLAGLLLLAFSMVLGGLKGGADRAVNRDEPVGWRRVLLIGTLSTAGFYGLFFLGMNRTSASSAAVVDGVGPIISSVLAHFVLHDDRLSWRRLMAILIAFAGCFTIALFRPRLGHGGSDVDPFGCFLIVIGLVIGSCGTMLVITYRGRLGLMQLTGFQMMAGGLLLLIVASITERQSWPQYSFVPARFFLLWLWLSCVSAVAFRLWYGLVRRYKVTALSVFSFMTSVWGAILSVLILKDRVTPQLVTGMLLVIAGVLLMKLDKSERRRELPPETEP